MKCPNCSSFESKHIELDNSLEAYCCSECKGVWIPSRNYIKFVSQNNFSYEGLDENIFSLIFSDKDSQNAKVCPDCGKAVVSSKAGFGASFYVDRCDNCFGIWLDENEWEKLKEKGLHTAIYYMFSSSWKHKVRKQTQMEIKVQSIKDNFEPEQAQKILDFMNWLVNQEDKDKIQSFLIS
ncbi:zf-TFIIB domain-containing protein [Spirochaeta cellobiosiphila]|uniref:TFIIB-type zinc ribbon-containing protein n=1 Tax=Spirochaeta cellobiosiphila TaxID=504483 RepID=UPI000425C6E2|nr:zf-TFIIB domain-containing protein [Spirochaeta cellobiosiphila]